MASHRRAKPMASSSSRRPAWALSEPFQGPGELAPERFALKELPVVELGAVPEAKAGEEVAAIQGRRLGERGRHREQTPRWGARVCGTRRSSQGTRGHPHARPNPSPAIPTGGPWPVPCRRGPRSASRACVAGPPGPGCAKLPARTATPACPGCGARPSPPDMPAAQWPCACPRHVPLHRALFGACPAGTGLSSPRAPQRLMACKYSTWIRNEVSAVSLSVTVPSRLLGMVGVSTPQRRTDAETRQGGRYDPG